MNVLVYDDDFSKEEADEQKENKATEHHIHLSMRLDFDGRLATKSTD